MKTITAYTERALYDRYRYWYGFVDWYVVKVYEDDVLIAKEEFTSLYLRDKYIKSLHLLRGRKR